MTHAMRISTFDRLISGGRSFRLKEKTDDGYIFEGENDPKLVTSFGFDEFRALLNEPEVILERDYFLLNQTLARQSTKVQAMADLNEEDASEVHWRTAFVQSYLHLQRNGEANRTEPSVARVLPELERAVNKLATTDQDGWVPRRAGNRRVLRKPPCARTLLEWVRRFERAGNSPLGLVSRIHRSGNTRSRFGREELRLIGQSIERYLTRNGPFRRRVAEDCRRLFASENEKRSQSGAALLKVPSKRKIERAIAKLDPYTTYAQRHGIEAANREFHLYEGGIDASYPMERIEIDEWFVDLISILVERGALDGLSAKELAELPRGRRWLYLAIDCATRCVVGMRLAVTPNKKDAVALLSDVTRDKTDIAIAAGCQPNWDQFGGLGTVATDLGPAFVNDNFWSAVFDVLGTPETPPGGLPQMRARVERIFGTLGSDLMPGLAGRTFSNPRQRGDFPSEETASLTDDDLMQLLVLYVVDIYHNRPHAGLKGETPANCWKRLASEKGVVPDISERLRRRAFGQRKRVKVTGKGVCVFGIDYTCSALRQFFLHDHDTEVDLRVDLNDLGWIVVRVGGTWYPALALQKCFVGVSFDDWSSVRGNCGSSIDRRLLFLNGPFLMP